MNFVQKALTSLLAYVSLMACDHASTSELMRNAKPEDPTVKVVRVRDGDLIRFILISNAKGYELTCDNPLGLLKLIDATGFPSTLVNSYPALDVDSEQVSKLKFREQPQLSCTAGGGDQVLYKIDLDNTTKYFLAANKTSTNLYMFGCQALVNAMGFDLGKATSLPSIFVDQNPIFNVADDKDMNCLTGVSIGSKVKWENGFKVDINVRPGINIPAQSYSAKNPDGSHAALSLKTEGRCEWLETIQLPGSLILSGQVPDNFRGQQCKATIIASSGTLMEDFRLLNIQTCSLDTVYDKSGKCLKIINQWATDSTLETKEQLLYSVIPDYVDTKTGWTGGMIDSDGVVYKTVDGGKSWKQQHRIPGRSIDAVSFVNAKVGWAVGGGGLVVKTIDGGTTWTMQSVGSDNFLPGVVAIDELHAIISTYEQGLSFRTEDGGKTWLKFKAVTAPNESTGNFTFVDANKGFVSTNNGFVVQIKTTEDGGQTWSTVSTLPAGYFVYDFFALDYDNLWIASNEGNILKSTDGGYSWAIIKSGLSTFMSQIYFLDEKTGFTNGSVLQATTDGGRTWRALNRPTGETFDAGMSVVDASHIWLMGSSAHMAIPLAD